MGDEDFIYLSVFIVASVIALLWAGELAVATIIAVYWATVCMCRWVLNR